ncbi:MAG: phosphodiesterase, partial [Clostridia bacterium]|nr:phosphodiesterase [Clostridia bacterium]
MKTTNEFYKLDMSKVPIAHRGLWGNGIPENSLSSYAHAKEKGFPVEIDLYRSKDGEIFSVHDRNLLRLTGKDMDICLSDSSSVKELSICGSAEKIPTLKETLSLLDGK